MWSVGDEGGLAVCGRGEMGSDVGSEVVTGMLFGSGIVCVGVIGVFRNVGKVVRSVIGEVWLGVGVDWDCEKGNFVSSKSTCLLVMTLWVFGS